MRTAPAATAPAQEVVRARRHAHDPEAGARLIGARVPLVDSVDKVTGRAVYTDDLRLPGLAHGVFVRSPRAHARIVAIEVDRARSVPGVVAVLTGLDEVRVPGVPAAGRIGDRRFGILPVSQDEVALPADKVRFVGEPVALVVAEDVLAAQAGAREVGIRWQDLETRSDPARGLEPVGEKIHPDVGKDGSDVHKVVEQSFGDVAAAFQDAALVLSGTYRFAGLTHGFTEPHAVIADYGADGRLTVWSATQVPHYLHRALAGVTGLPMHRIRVVRLQVGGGFGGKGEPLPHELAAAFAAIRIGRPVKVVLDREGVFYSGRGRHPTVLDMRLAVGADGRVRGLELDTVLDGGAFASFGVITTYYNGSLCTAPYRMPAFHYRGRRVYTNRVPSGAMRGHGGVNNRCALETLLDEAAQRLGLDPFDLRLRNLVEPDSRTVNGLRITSMGLGECLARVRAESRWDERFRRLPLGRGLGLGCGFFISGSNLPIHWDIDPARYPQSTVHLKLDLDGGVTVHTGAAEIGQGSDTVAAMVVAEVLGIGLDRVRVRSRDTDTAPFDLGSYSSRVTFMMGNAARRAAEELRGQLLSAAARRLGRDPARMVVSDGRVCDATRPQDGLSFDEAVKEAVSGHGALVARGTFVATPHHAGFKGAAAGTSPAYSMSAYVAEVEVDPETGLWRCRHVWAAHDCGRVLNRSAVEGQIEGAVHMGLGQVMGEELVYEGAALRNPRLLDYRIPTSLEMPGVTPILVETFDAEGPFGAKEAGEGPLIPVLPAVLNALYDAVGVRVRGLPVTPDRLYEAMVAAGGPSKPRGPARQVP